MPTPFLLYQVHTRILLVELSRDLGRRATLDDIPETLIASWAAQGFGWVWFLGLWSTGVGRDISRAHAGMREEAARTLPDFSEEDIAGSPFSIRDYRLHPDFGEEPALARLRRRLAAQGLRLMADFVVNHVAPDHGWMANHPEWFITGSEADRAEAPGNWTSVATRNRDFVVAHGRDPYFPGWADTLQLNLRHPACREALRAELLRLAGVCDGLRCDMAMLAQTDIFAQTWGDRALPKDGSLPAGDEFWPESIRRVKAAYPEFTFLAEVYWGREGALQAEGFDFTYDKRLYDRLRQGDAAGVRGHLMAAPEFQSRSLRFLENHDEERVAAAFPEAMHRAAALIAFLIPGMKLMHHGQDEGRRIRLSMHVGRRPVEILSREWKTYYGELLSAVRRPEAMEGGWTLLIPAPAWEGNPTTDQFIAFTWHRQGRPGLLAVANYGPHQGQCHVRLETGGFEQENLRLRDLLSDALYVRAAKDLNATGMYFDMPPWGFHLFEIL